MIAPLFLPAKTNSLLPGNAVTGEVWIFQVSDYATNQACGIQSIHISAFICTNPKDDNFQFARHPGTKLKHANSRDHFHANKGWLSADSEGVMHFSCLTNRTALELRVRRSTSKFPRLWALVVPLSPNPDEAERCTCAHESNNPISSVRLDRSVRLELL